MSRDNLKPLHVYVTSKSEFGLLHLSKSSRQRRMFEKLFGFGPIPRALALMAILTDSHEVAY